MIADISVTEKSFGPKSLYSNVRFSIQKGEKIGFVGRNGIGKSTLLGIIDGTDTDFTGEIQIRRGTTIMSTRQEHHGFNELSTIEYVLNDLPEFTKLHHIITTYPETMGDDMRKITQYTEALERFDSLGYYQAEELIIQELAHFQIDEAKARGNFANLSGGQKRLVEVVKIMHAQTDLALIDEPTNHMDFVAKKQFIDWLKKAPMSMIIITHDRDVLGEVDKIIELRDGGSLVFPGNYQAYLKQNATSTTTKMHDYEVTQREIENVKNKIVQFRRLKERARDPDTIKQFKRREQQAAAELAELQKIEKPTFWIDKASVADLKHSQTAQYEKYKAKNIRLHGLASGHESANRLLVKAEKSLIGYDPAAPLATISFELREGERVELRGRNGAGKTTFIKALLDRVHEQKAPTLLGGQLSVAPKITVGVYEQEISSRYLDLPLAAAIERLYLDRGLTISNQRIQQLLSEYLFTQTDADIPLAKLSGGQKARFQLICMLAGSPQLLVLDEPTNHLDLPSIEELETALARYTGAIMYVSHDDFFRQHLPATVVAVGVA